MVQVGTVSWNLAGDVGGVGITRFRFINQTTGVVTGSDCDAAAAASHAFINASAGVIPGSITWTCQPIVEINDDVTGLVVPPLPITTVPAPIVGLGSSGHGAGLGMRVNWKTSQILGRRLVRGAVYLVPLTSSAFGGDGGVLAAVAGTANTAAATYLAAMVAANLYPVVWHRPPKKTTTGGTHAIIVAGLASTTPAGLRSRRS